MIEIAQQYISEGISVIPIKTNGSKSPAQSGWRKYSNQLPSQEELQEWFGGGQLIGIGAVPGPASGNMVVLDFECKKNESAYSEWLLRLPDELKEIVSQWRTVATPSGGRHIWIRLNESQPGGKRARYPDGSTKIEVRGEGHQVLAPGCPTECHPSGQEYRWLIEGEIPTLTMDQWVDILRYCDECNEFFVPEQTRDFMRTGSPTNDGAPGNDFNLHGSWHETGLFDAGWSWAGQFEGERGYLTRPGKSSGVSASIGMITSKEKGYPYFYCWSTSVPDFSAETPYSKFAVYATLKHSGDYAAAAKELRRIGYGDPEFDRSKFIFDENGVKVDISKLCYNLSGKKDLELSPAAKERWFRWMTELEAAEDNTQWLWEGYIPRQQVTLFSAYWKSGKTTLLSHLLKAFDGSTSEFLGQPITPSRVLYITEEDERTWANRRDQLLIGDHVGMKIRPFPHKPTLVDWRKFCAEAADVVQQYQFDLVVMDTLSKLWPVKDENHATDVEEALQDLWKITNRGAAVFLVHHSRKSGGAEFVGSRGSGGLPAFADILMEFSRMDANSDKDRRRKIKAIGRWNDFTPESKVITLLDHNQYICVDDDPLERRAAMREDWPQLVLDMLVRPENTGMTVDEVCNWLREQTGKAVRTKDMRDWLRCKVEDGEVVLVTNDDLQGRGHNKKKYASPDA